ncbi:MAG: hypothetical protein KAJ51_08655 [Thermoplasmata archaeon]|nr:hypothetical protein [Thermoplasmata archaeon]
MKFGVVVCQNCNWAVGVNLNSKSTKCRRCNHPLNLKSRKILYETNSEQDLVKAVGQTNVKLQKGEAEYQDLLKSLEMDEEDAVVERDGLFAFDESQFPDPYSKIAHKLKSLDNFQTKLVTLANELCKEFNEFSIEDFNTVLELIGLKPEDSEKYIAQLISNSIIYEPRVGYYRILND